MERAKHKQPGPGKPRAPTDWGKRIAQLLCLVFALIGIIPLSGGLLMRSEPIKRWAAAESSRLLRDQLGLSATFQVELSLIPLRLRLLELSVRDRSRKEPAIYAQSIVIAPRFFSLLAGRIDVGDIELENSSVRLVVQDGAVQNIAVRLPERKQSDTSLTRSPFRTLAVTNVNLDLQLDDRHATVEGIDLDAIADRGLTFDVALRVAGADVASKRPLAATATADPQAPPVAQLAHDEDRLCSFEVHAQVSKTAIDIQRLALVAAFDTEAGADLGAQCDDLPDHQLALRLAQFSITELDQTIPHVRGNIMLKAPLLALNRVSPSLRGEGWASFSGSAAWASGMRLPELSGQLSGERMKVNDYKISDELSAEVLLSKETVFVPRLMARWGNGTADARQLRIEPFAPKMPLEIAHVSTRGIDLPGVLREILMTDHPWVDWNFGETEIDRVRGTISPFYIDGGVEGHTKDFVIWDRGFDDPARNRMFGIPLANVKGRFRANEQSLDFYNCDLRFGTSFLPVELVSIRFYPNELTVRIKPGGGDVDLADLGRIANVTLTGKSHVFADLNGPMNHPVLKGTLAVTDLSIAGFPAGDVDETQVHFEPLFLEMTDLRGNKGPMNYHLPKARLSFDGPASVEFTTKVTSDKFSLAEFLNVFHFDEDERFADLVGNGRVTGNVRYLLGGPEDRCKSGRLLVQGQAQLTKAELLDEQFSGGQGDFSLDWFDIDAGLLGLSLDIGALTLRKGTGTLYGSASVRHGGALTGDIIASKIPLSRLDLLPKTLSSLDGFVAGSAHLSGSLDALVIDSDLLVSELRMGQGVLPPSQLKLRLSRDPQPTPPDARLTACGGHVPSPTPIKSTGREGELLVNGQLFNGSIAIHDFKIVQQQDPVMTGELAFVGLDLHQLDAFLLAPGEPARVSSGALTGKLVLDELLVNAPFSSRAELQIDTLVLVSSQVTFSLAQAPLIVRLGDQALSAPTVVLSARTKSGHTGIVDGNFTLRGPSELSGALRLRPTSLQVLAAATPMVERAEGELTAALDVTGSLAEPIVRGDINVQKGFVKLSGLSDAVEDLNLHAALDKQGIHLDRGRARFAGGNVDVKGELPLSDGSLGQLELGVVARGIHYKSPDQIQVTLDADLKLLALRHDGSGASLLPSLSGSVDILSADYQKPMSLTADISTLTTRGDKTEISGYDAAKDHVELDLLLRGTRALNVKNELVQANLRLDPAGLRVTGTDQRFGAVGTVEVQPGGRIFLRRNEFEVQTGLVRFNDPTRLRPEVDVSAITEYRRYNTVGGAPGQSNQSDSSASTVGSGNWRISMHAYGPPENLKVDLTSDPPLGQDDIFLLLTVGLTRTELDQSRNSGVGSSVALEALGTLSGAESAVTDVVPVDEFRFGSTYSSRSGRTEPTVTIGKRLSDRIRASVTTSLSETSEIRSNVEYRATQNVSVEGSFDNARNVASAAGGNLGGDVRWRIEFR